MRELEEKDKKLVLELPEYILQPASQEQGRTDVESPEIILVIKMQNREMYSIDGQPFYFPVCIICIYYFIILYPLE